MTLVVTSDSPNVICGHDVATLVGGSPTYTVAPTLPRYTVNVKQAETAIVTSSLQRAVQAAPATKALVVCGFQGPPGVSAQDGVRVSRTIPVLVNRDIDTVLRSDVVAVQWTVVLLDTVLSRYKRFIVSAVVNEGGPDYVVYGMLATGKIPVETSVTNGVDTMVLAINNLHSQILTANVSRIDINRVI